MNAFSQLQANLARNAAFEAEGDDVVARGNPPVTLFAFYLPQFHPIPENDAWWGKGFTEWTNATRGLPRFEGHYQPHLPADLGFYDLRMPDALRAQVSMAKRYGVGGFCFHWYWFGGRRLLERPLNILLQNQDIDFPFFVNWANENWTRRWDGREDAILIEQQSSAEDDFAIADALCDLARDPRYFRIEGRPAIMLYRPSALPNALATIARWRTRFRERGERDPFLFMPQVHGQSDPRTYGMDAAVQFPPHKIGSAIESPRAGPEIFDHLFSGQLFDYAKVAERVSQAREPEGFPLFRGLCPGWDNEARQPNRGHTLVESTPRRYGRWLARAIRTTLATKPSSSRLVFVNAWNEWAEGAHLEPDAHFGHAYLRETCRALDAARDSAALEAFIEERTDKPGKRNINFSRVRRALGRTLRAPRG